MLRIISLMVLAITIAGCGNKGALYLPSSSPQGQAGETPAQNQQAPRK